MTLDLEYWREKISFITDFLKWLENEEKTMICSFFKFSVLKHFWSLKLIDRVDFRVLLMFYSFQVIWVDLNDEFEKWTKYSKKLINTEFSRHLIWWYFCLFFLMIDWNWLPPPQTHIFLLLGSVLLQYIPPLGSVLLHYCTINRDDALPPCILDGQNKSE